MVRGPLGLWSGGFAGSVVLVPRLVEIERRPTKSQRNVVKDKIKLVHAEFWAPGSKGGWRSLVQIMP